MATAWIKPKKPWPEYPLTFTPRGQVKKYNGKPRYVCPNDTPAKEAVKILAAKYSEWDEVDAGTKAANDISSVRGLLNRWLNLIDDQVQRGKRTDSYYSAARRAVRRFLTHVKALSVSDLTPEHFSSFGHKLEDKHSLAVKSRSKSLRIIMAAFNYAEEEDWIDRPVKFGKTAKSMAYARDDKLPMNKARTAADFMKIMAAMESQVKKLQAGRERDLSSALQLRAGIWLAINGGYGGADLGELPLDVVDLDNGQIDYRRGKTKAERVVPLMPETIEALKPVIAMAIFRKDTLLFRTREGAPWHREIAKRTGDSVSTTTIDNFQQAYSKLLRSIEMKRPGAGFYELKHTHCELADAAGDVHAAMRIVGHALPFSRDPYIRVTDDRLRKVVAFVRDHLIVAPATPQKTSRRRNPAGS